MRPVLCVWTPCYLCLACHLYLERVEESKQVLEGQCAGVKGRNSEHPRDAKQWQKNSCSFDTGTKTKSGDVSNHLKTEWPSPTKDLKKKKKKKKNFQPVFQVDLINCFII